MQAFILLLVVLGCTTQAFRSTPFVHQSRLHNSYRLMSSPSFESSTKDTSKFDRPSIFVGNLPFSVSEEQLQNEVKKRLGDNLQSCTIVRDKFTGKSRGFAYVNVNDDSKIENALSALAGTQLDGRSLNVDINSKNKLKPRREGKDSFSGAKDFKNFNTAEGERAPKRNFAEINERSIYIGNLDVSVSKDSFQSIVDDRVGADAGIVGYRLSIFPDTGRCKGFGHIEFSSKELAEAALAKLSGLQFAGRNLNVSIAGVDSKGKAKTGSSEGSPSASTYRTIPNQTVFIGNLSWDVTKEVMEDMLSDIVGPKSFNFVRVAMDKNTGRPRGFAHVEFADPETADRAVKELTGLEVMGRTLRADISTGDRFKGSEGN